MALRQGWSTQAARGTPGHPIEGGHTFLASQQSLRADFPLCGGRKELCCLPEGYRSACGGSATAADQARGGVLTRPDIRPCWRASHAQRCVTVCQLKSPG